MRLPFPLPFLSGPPDFSVRLRPIAPAAWLRPDWEAASLTEKRALLAHRPDDVQASDPSGAAQRRAAARRIAAALHVEETDLVALFALISDDLVVLRRDPDAWRVVAALLTSPTYFSAHEVIGRDLAAIHDPVKDRLGAGGQQALAQRMGRVFDRLPADTPLERFNWTVQAGDARFTPIRPPPEAGPAHLRIERQTVRALPDAHGLLFTIRVSLIALAPLLEDAVVRGAFAAAWRGAPAHVRAYKRWDDLNDLISPLLR